MRPAPRGRAHPRTVAAGAAGSIWGHLAEHGGGLTDAIVFGRIAAPRRRVPPTRPPQELLMPEMTIEVKTPRGTMPVYVKRPDADKAAPVVVLYMDAPGIRPALHGHAERLAGAGYTAVLPDLYYPFDPAERPDPEKLAARDPDEFARMRKLQKRISDDDVIEDTRLLL